MISPFFQKIESLLEDHEGRKNRALKKLEVIKSLRFYKIFRKIYPFVPLVGILVGVATSPKIWGGEEWFSMFGIGFMVVLPLMVNLIYGDDVKIDVKKKQTQKQKAFKRPPSLATMPLLTYAEQYVLANKNQKEAEIWQKLKNLAEQEKLYTSQWEKLSSLLEKEIKKVQSSSIKIPQPQPQTLLVFEKEHVISNSPSFFI